MKMLDLDDQELELLVTPVRTCLDDFGHAEAEILCRVKVLRTKLQAATDG